jgi:hypothetical protein
MSLYEFPGVNSDYSGSALKALECESNGHVGGLSFCAYRY